MPQFDCVKRPKSGEWHYTGQGQIWDPYEMDTHLFDLFPTFQTVASCSQSAPKQGDWKKKGRRRKSLWRLQLIYNSSRLTSLPWPWWNYPPLIFLAGDRCQNVLPPLFWSLRAHGLKNPVSCKASAVSTAGQRLPEICVGWCYIRLTTIQVRHRTGGQEQAPWFLSTISFV